MLKYIIDKRDENSVSIVFADRVKFCSSCTECWIPRECLNTEIIHCFTITSEIWNKSTESILFYVFYEQEAVWSSPLFCLNKT